jgi:hypothetical protein
LSSIAVADSALLDGERDLGGCHRADVDSFRLETMLVRSTNAVLAQVGAALVARGIARPTCGDMPTLEDVYMRLVEGRDA